ncbi:MAG: threonine synthase [Nanoarchaeota archaeon]
MSRRILYHSTNRNANGKANGFKQSFTFKQALFMGLAPDNGLLMPSEIPKLSKNFIMGLKGKPYHEVAYDILKRFLSTEIKSEELKEIVKSSYNFGIPMEKLDGLTWIIRLDQGPTASFKDFAAILMARLMQKLKPKNKKITILVATSGDTGSAIGEAFRGLKDIKVYILYPKNEVSSIQKRHMDTIGKNVTTISIEGKFDDCQKMVKRAFADPDLKRLNLTSGNSISIGRILPQIVYYFYAYANIVDEFKPVVFSIPSGNFGNSFGCEFARRMGLPVKKIIIATNENDEFPKFLKTGVYRKVEPARKCISNAMNIGNPNNLVRYFNLYHGMIDKNGVVYKNPDIKEMKRHIFSVAISDKETIRIISWVYVKYDTIVEPHGAVGIAALQKYRKFDKKTLAICIETAHPAKFPETIKEELKVWPGMPKPMRIIYKRKGKPYNLSKSYSAFKRFLLRGLIKYTS